ncbi:MAG: hypothetical protein ACTHOU_18985 [Aureliella sp.]
MSTAEINTIETKFIVETKPAVYKKLPVVMEFSEGRIVFVKSPFALKDDIKAMAGARWLGYEDKNPRKAWSVKDCPRNRFQIRWLEGENVYEWFERPLIEHHFDRPLLAHQRMMANTLLTRHFHILAAEMGTGKTLTAIETMEKSGHKHWFWVGPVTTLPAIEREFRKWNLDPSIKVEMMSYDRLISLFDTGFELPGGVIFDESSKLKTPGINRTCAAQELADRMRAAMGHDAFVILMSGTPSPKTPCDIWAQAEIAYPGFLREGSYKALEQRLAVLQKADTGEFGNHYMTRLGWLDRGDLCKKCCQTLHDGPHDLAACPDPIEYHAFEPCENEVANLFQRLEGLMTVVHKRDCLDLPKKIYKRVYLEPSNKLLRVAKTIANTASTTVTGLNQLRQLSDGFLYKEVEDGKQCCRACEGKGTIKEWYNSAEPERTYQAIDMFSPEVVASLQEHEVECPQCQGTKEVPRMTRVAHEVSCPKEDAVIEYLEKNEVYGRMCLFAGFQGSVDRCVRICQENGWDVFKCDGRGSRIIQADGTILHNVKPLDYWADLENNAKVCFVANPETGGFGLTLTEAKCSVYYSNSYKPEYRSQSEDRTHRTGQDEDVMIVDLIHLPTDERTLEILKENHKLELMVLGEIVGDSLDS